MNWADPFIPRMDYPPHTPFNSVSGLSTQPFGVRDSALIIEDNEGIASLLTILLRKTGLKVIWSQTGLQALAEFDRQQEHIAFVLSDCRLPDCDGRAICQRMREQRSDLPLLLSSGSAAFLNLGPIASGRLVRFLPKPYTPMEMMEQVRRLQAEWSHATAEVSVGFV